MDILIILLFAVIIFSGLTVAYLMYHIDELKLENDDLNETCNFLNESRKVIVRKKDCSTIPFKSHVAFDRDLSEFIIVIDLIEDDK